jgi:hypothetical protein
MGVAEAGHYLSYINVERGREGELDWADMQKQNWLEFNDTRVDSWDIKNLLEEKCFGATREKTQ